MGPLSAGVRVWITASWRSRTVRLRRVLALLGPVGRTHNPAPLLHQALDRSEFDPSLRESVARLIECAERLGPEVHAQSDYGDEMGWRTPWELFDESAAQQALGVAEEAVRLASEIVQGG